MIVFQINCSSAGSTGTIMKEIHERLICMNFESYCAYGIGKKTEKNEYKLSNYFESHIHDRLSKFFGLQGYFSFFKTVYLCKKISEINPDIIHLHNLHGNYLCLPVLFNYLKSYTGRVVFTLHDCWMFTGKCPHFYDAKCNRWMIECGDCQQLGIYPKSYFFDFTRKCLKDKKKWIEKLQNCQIITVSQWLNDTAKKSYLGAYPIKTIYNGVNTKVFFPRKLRSKYLISIPNDVFIILAVASVWAERKGLSDLILLAEKIKADECIVIVGLTESQIAKMPRNVLGITHTDNADELAEIYSSANVLVNPSTEETFGMVVAESMACGTPVIVNDSTACSEIVTEDTGRIVSPHDVEGIYKAICEIRKTGKKIFSPNCTSLIQRKYTKDIMVDNYIDFYREIS